MGPPKGTTIEPKRLPRRPWGQFQRQEALGADFGTDFWSSRDLKTHDFTREGRQKSRFSCLASGQQNRAQNGPKMSSTSTPKQLPEGQNVAQKRCWISGSILASMLTLFGVSQKAPKISQKSPSAPKGRQEASGEPSGWHFKHFWTSF